MAIYGGVRMLDYHVYRMVKFDRLLNVEKVYILRRRSIHGRFSCECEGARRGDCRHAQTLPLFIGLGRVDKGWFYDIDNKRWERPLNDPVRAFNLQLKVKT